MLKACSMKDFMLKTWKFLAQKFPGIATDCLVRASFWTWLVWLRGVL